MLFQKFNLTACTDKDFLVYLYSFRDFDNFKSPFNVYLFFQDYLKYFYESVFESKEEIPYGVKVLDPKQDLSHLFKDKSVVTSIETSTGKVFRKEHPITGKVWYVEINLDNFGNIEIFYTALKILYSNYLDKLETGEYVPKYEFPLPDLREFYHKRIYSDT